MTDQARLYGAVLYELKLPEDMVYETGRILKRKIRSWCRYWQILALRR